MVKRMPRSSKADAENDTMIFPKKVDEQVSGGFVEAVEEREKHEKENKAKAVQESNERREKLNGAAEIFLSCLEASSARDIRNASRDYKIKDIGLYLLGLINRLVKTVDIYEPDIEKEWETGKVGWNSVPICKYCNIEIPQPKNVGQIYCSNRCAKRDREYSKTGVLFPSDRSSVLSDTALDEKKWEQEQKRLGAI